MVKVQLDLNEKEDEFVEAYMSITGIKSKPDAIRKMVEEYGVGDPDIGAFLKIKKKRGINVKK